MSGELFSEGNVRSPLTNRWSGVVYDGHAPTNVGWKSENDTVYRPSLRCVYTWRDPL